MGGRPKNNHRALLLKNCLDSCNMIDLGFSGPPFTWSNCQDPPNLIQSCLDRVYANSEWITLFLNSFVKHLPKTHSDHCPILMSLASHPSPCLERPFRMELMWYSHPTFPPLVKYHWGPSNLDLANISNMFADYVRIWNKETFSNIFFNKKCILARLQGKKCLPLNPSPKLC